MDDELIANELFGLWFVGAQPFPHSTLKTSSAKPRFVLDPMTRVSISTPIPKRTERPSFWTLEFRDSRQVKKKDTPAFPSFTGTRLPAWLS